MYGLNGLELNQWHLDFLSHTDNKPKKVLNEAEIQAQNQAMLLRKLLGRVQGDEVCPVSHWERMKERVDEKKKEWKKIGKKERIWKGRRKRKKERREDST